MTDEEDARRQPVDGPTVMGPSTGHLRGPVPEEPTVPSTDEPTRPTTSPDEPTLASPAAAGATEAEPAPSSSSWSSSPPAVPRGESTAAEPTPGPPPPSWPSPADAQPQGDVTIAEPTSRSPRPAAASPPDEPTIANPPPTPERPEAGAAATPQDEPTVAEPGLPASWPNEPPTAAHDEPTITDPASPAPSPNGATHDEPTIAETASPVAWPDGATGDAAGGETTLPGSPDEPTMAVVDESPTATGPTVASWPLDELLPPPPTDLVWRPDVPEPPPAVRRPAYYVALGASVVLVVALVAAAALATVMRPTREVAGTARAAQAIPDITGSAPPPTTTAVPPRAGPGEHPLSTSTARMADVTCDLPRFDLADDRQAAFYAAAKSCADSAWRGVLDEAGLAATVEVVTVTAPVQTGSCGEITPNRPSTQCDGTVYMTPAHLRDTEQNGRYPGRYLGVFLREYARALQFATGLSELAAGVDDAEARLAQQATCMAGVASGAMAGRGAVDANITGEISDRLSSVDAPPDAKAMLDKGFQERTLNACNTW